MNAWAAVRDSTPLSKKIIKQIVQFIREVYRTDDFIPLHEPRFRGREKEYLLDAIDSTFVSTVGEYVSRFEEKMCEITGAPFAVATVNGTAALHTALMLSGVEPGDEVLTQPLTFVATGNAVSYCGARPVFLDVDRETFGMDAGSLEAFLTTKIHQKGEVCYNRDTGRRIAACLPVHVFGHPCRIDLIEALCREYHLPLIEDAAESLGSTYRGKQTGRFGIFGVYSFNGNKTVTCGGGGALVTDNEELARLARHVTTTSKVPHPYEYVHDRLGYNYRLPNINAALACAQLEQLEGFLENKRELAHKYEAFFSSLNIPFVTEPNFCRSNYWLNAVILANRKERDGFLEAMNGAGIMTRPAWELLNRLKMFKGCQVENLKIARWLGDRLVNIPSSVTP